jgi:primosomal protein N' (replication factor Y)
MSTRIAQIALPVALRQALSYAVPPELDGILEPGHRVRVPIRGRETHGYVLSIHPAGEAPATTGRLKAILEAQPAEPLLDSRIMKVALWVADYYACPVGEVLEAALPAQVWKGRPRRGREPDLGDATPDEPLPLTPHQEEALASILESLGAGDAAKGPRPAFLLQGVAGSGKTEVYLQLAAHLAEQGRGTLVLVPEIAMGTQLVQRFARRLGSKVGFFHSGMPAGQRRATWWRARQGEIQVVVGARSAVFVPIRDLGAVVVDEEHESAYKQTESPRYHGRDVAVLRASFEAAVTVLGSATPSLESRRNVEQGKYRRLLLPERVEKRPPATVVLVDLRPSTVEDGAEPEHASVPEVVRQPRVRGQVFSPLLLQRLRSCMEKKEQAILFLNRRGHSTSVQCQDCGHVYRCPNCSVILTFHRHDAVLRCHHCGHVVRDVRTCPSCQGEEFLFGGLGTQKVEGQLRRHVPDARVLRMDLDTTRRRGAHKDMIESFERRDVDILVGTQMVGKGLDFPGVTLVGVLLADREMAIPDFRAQERAFQILTQVAGRAGRGDRPGEVVFQTFMPEHFVIRAAALQDYEEFYAAESKERRALGFPPYSRLVHLLLDDPREERVVRRSKSLQRHVLEWMAMHGVRNVEVLGPAPMVLERLRNRYRWHLTLKGPTAKSLRAVVGECLQWDRTHRSSVRLMVDVDPLHSM